MTAPVLAPASALAPSPHQERLLALAVDRLRAARPGALPDGPADLADLLRLRATIADQDGPGETHVVAVVRGFSPAEWVAQVCAFALTLEDPEAVGAWRHSLTRTVFLAGDPERLGSRFTFHHLAPDGSVGWCAPATAGATAPLRRLLKPFAALAPVPVLPPAPVRVPAPVPGPAGPRPPRREPVHRDLYVATAGATLPQLLIHTHHLLAEAVLDGLIEPGDRLTLRHVPSLTGTGVPLAAVRVDVEGPQDPHRLRAWAGLTEASPVR